MFSSFPLDIKGNTSKNVTLAVRKTGMGLLSIVLNSRKRIDKKPFP